MSTGLQKQLKGALLGSLFASFICANGIVAAAPEVEPNDTQEQAKLLDITDTGASVTSMMGTAPGPGATDLDIYAFDAKIDDVPSIMVVSDGTWDSLLVLYNSDGTILDMNDDAFSMNPGSASELDSRLDTYKLTASGRYYVAVTPIPRYLGGSFQVALDTPADGGSYRLVVQGVTSPPPPPAPEPDPIPTPTPDPVATPTPDPVETPTPDPVATPTPDPVATPTPDPVATPTPEPTPAPLPSSGGSDPQVVTILVMDWHGDDPSLGKYKGKHPIPVAIMSARGFNATTMIDEKSLTFGATGTERSLLRCKRKDKDVRVDKVKDGMKDLICYFRPDVAGFTQSDVQAVLNGKLVRGGKIEATATLRTFEVSKKKQKSWHKRHNVDPRGKKYRPRDHRKSSR